MGFVPVAPPSAFTEGQVDYRLARQAVLRQYRDGLLTKADVCDAHPELRRAAELQPENARFAYVYAVALNSMGQAEAAVDYLATVRHATLLANTVRQWKARKERWRRHGKRVHDAARIPGY